MVQLLAEALFIYLFSKTSILALGPTQRTGELVSCGRVDRMWTGCGQDVELTIHLHFRAKVKSDRSYTSTTHILS